MLGAPNTTSCLHKVLFYYHFVRPGPAKLLWQQVLTTCPHHFLKLGFEPPMLLTDPFVAILMLTRWVGLTCLSPGCHKGRDFQGGNDKFWWRIANLLGLLRHTNNRLFQFQRVPPFHLASNAADNVNFLICSRKIMLPKPPHNVGENIDINGSPSTIGALNFSFFYLFFISTFPELERTLLTWTRVVLFTWPCH